MNKRGEIKDNLEEEIRTAFEKEYGTQNDLGKNSNGEYNDWNLQLTYACWRQSWLTCLINIMEKK